MPVAEIPIRVRRGTIVRSLVLLVVFYVLGAGTLIGFAAHTALARAPLASWSGGGLALLAVGGWLVLGAAMLFGVLDAYRFRFGPQHLNVFTWRGWRASPWSDVRSARLAAVRFDLRLLLVFGRGRIVSVPLLDYYGGARLLSDIEHRLPVAVAAPPALQARLEKASAT